MRKKKEKSPPKNGQTAVTFFDSPEQWNRDFALGRRQAIKDKQKQNAELDRRAVYRRKLKTASAKRAPKTLRTKGYYRFSREYPGNVDPSGFRENTVGKKTLRRRRRLTVLASVLAFCLAFVVTKTCIYTSRSAPETTAPAASVTDSRKLAFKALHISYEDLRDLSGEALAAQVGDAKCSAAVLEMKDPGGNVMFESAETAGTDADRHIPALEEKLKALKNAGLSTIAAVSCFSDTEAALANPDMSVRVGEADGIVWLDNDARAWLNPFSEDARAYVLALVSEMASLGFDSVLLDNVCFSTEAGNGSPFYAGEGLYNGTRNQILRTFISDAVQACAGAQVLLMGNVAAFSEESDADNVRYDGNFLRIPAASLCLDARVSRQERQVTVGTETFRDIGSMADIFILSAAGYAVNAVKESGVSNPVTVCIDRPEDLAAAGADLSGVEGLIIW